MPESISEIGARSASFQDLKGETIPILAIHCKTLNNLRKLCYFLPCLPSSNPGPTQLPRAPADRPAIRPFLICPLSLERAWTKGHGVVYRSYVAESMRGASPLRGAS